MVNENKFHSLKAFFTQDSTHFVSNVKTKMAALFHRDLWCPLTVNDKEYKNALICSPYTTYVIYPLGELKKFKKYWIKFLIVLNASVMAIICRATKFNRVIQVNNNLNSLIKHPAIFSPALPEITKQLTQTYPNHAITFFRVNDALDETFLKTLQQFGYIIFPDRAAHVFFLKNNFISRSHTKRDLGLLRKSPYQLVSHDQLTKEDGVRFSELYKQLFIDKHSQYNPVYTARYFQEAILNGWHHYTALRNNAGHIDAFISWFEKENVMMCGPLGYDVSIDQKQGLYRQLVALCLQYAHQNQLIFNMGGGSDEFKLNRGSEKTLEYTAVYYHHLSWYRCIPWKILCFTFNKFLKKIMDSEKL